MLKRKLFRDIKNNIAQFITIFLMVMIGVMAYSGIEAYMDGMQRSIDKYYKENNIFDLVVTKDNFTKEDLDKINNISDVSLAEGKLSLYAKTNDDKILLVNFIESNEISKFYVHDGISFDKTKDGVWLDYKYALENNIKVNDKVSIKYDTLDLEKEVLGLIYVPDHVYDVKDASELYPNKKDFGYAYLSSNELKDYVLSKNMTDIPFNRMMIKTNGNREIVKDELNKILTGNYVITDVEDTLSYKQYQGEINEGKTYVGVFSGLFLFIAILSVITTMNRLIKKERTQIGTLKALGFSNFRVLTYYIGYGFWVSLFGSIAGILAGYYGIGKLFISIEMDFFEVPNGSAYMNPKSYLVALLVVIIISFITYLTGKKILKKNPAETLRNEIPSVKKGSLNFTKKSIFKKLSFSSIWNVRDILRNKSRTIMGVIGVTASCMLIVCAIGMLNSMNHFIDLQFSKLYNFDYKLVLDSNITNENIEEIKKTYGDYSSETINVETVIDNNKENNTILVTDAKNYLRFINSKGKYINVSSDEGVYITRKLAKNNNLKVGDTIVWHVSGSDKDYTSKIIGLNKDPQNQNITMSKAYLDTLGITYNPDSFYTNVDLSNINKIDGVSIIQDIDSLAESMSDMLSMMKKMIALIIFIAAVLGIIIIYNLGILSYTEKQYQFATLKVLGFSDKKIEKIFVKQNNWIAIAAIVLGLPLGYMLTEWLFQTAIEEHYDFNAYILPITYIIATVAVYVISYIVSKFLSKKIKNIDMVSSLKGNE